MTADIGWHPGQSVVTEADHAQWQAWRKTEILAAQRHRRAHLRRIDYYPGREAAKVIDGLKRRQAGYDYSSVIDRLVLEAGRKLPE